MSSTRESLDQPLSTSIPGRIHWVDVAKSIAIVLVVLYHVAGAGAGHMFPNPDGPPLRYWRLINEVLLPVRMPIFFLTAGLLARHTLGRPWPVIARNRVLVLLWPYALWSVFFASIAGFVYRPEDPASYTVEHLLRTPFAASAYWFLLVLMIFYVTAKACRRRPGIVLAVSLFAMVLTPYASENIWSTVPNYPATALVRIKSYALWYFLGCYGFAPVSRIAQRNVWFLGGLSGFVFMLSTALDRYGDLPVTLLPVMSTTGMLIGIAISVSLARFMWVRRLSRYLAARTLPIYLLHPVLIVAGVLVLDAAWPDRPGMVAAATMATPFITAATVWVSVALYDRVIEGPLSWIYAPPALRTRLATASDHAKS